MAFCVFVLVASLFNPSVCFQLGLFYIPYLRLLIFFPFITP